MMKAKKGADSAKGKDASKGAAAANAKANSAKGGADAKDAGPLKRKLGLRGAAPWAARHAAKHAAEARARAAEPPLPGSARATIRTPAGAEDIKQKISELHGALAQIKSLRKNVNKTFFDIGTILKDVQARKLYEAKGFANFESFLEREIDLGKTTALRLVRVVNVFQKPAALELGMDRLFNALMALDAVEGVVDGERKSAVKLPPPPISTTTLPLRPPGR
jgi:hypothetical protein